LGVNFHRFEDIFENEQIRKEMIPLNLMEEWQYHSNIRQLLDKISFDKSKGMEWNAKVFGQRLTDFNNGIIFKEKVPKKYPDADGYMWKEDIVNGGITYCLFDYSKLEKPDTQKIYLSNE
jgi:hypothetical protein